MSKGTKAHGVIVGRMGKPLEVRKLNSGRNVGSVRLATTDGFGDHETTSWFDVVIFDEKKIEVLQKFTDKGSRIMAIGTLRKREYEKDGVKREITELIVSFDGSIELLDGKDDRPAGNNSREVGGQAQVNQSQTRPTGSAFDLDDDGTF